MGVLLAAWGWFDVWCVLVGALIAACVCAWVCLAGALRCCASCVECRAGPVLKSFHNGLVLRAWAMGLQKVGQKVKAKYLATSYGVRCPGDWFQGTISKVNADGTYNILYADGDKENAVHA